MCTFYECIQLLSKLPPSGNLSLSRRVLGVCVKHFFCLFHFSLKPLWVPALSFCYHKEIGVSIAGRALVAQAPVHCSME